VPDPLRAVFISQGKLGTSVLGLAMAAATTEAALAEHPGVDARFAGIGERGRAMRVALRPVPGLSPLDLDLYGLRFHLTESLRGLGVMREELRRAPADVIHLTTHTLGLLSGPIRRRAAVVLSVDVPIWEWGAMGHFRPPRPWRRAVLAGDLALERRAFERADLVLPWSAWARDAILRTAPRARTQVLHPGLDLARFSPGPPRPADGPVRLLFVGGRLEAKGGLDLIEAARPLLDDGRAELDVVTPEEVPPTPGVRVHRLGSGDDELIGLYQRADVFCLPSWGDASPFVVLEAMACGAAVLGSAVGAVPEMLEDGAAGVVAAPRDLPGLRAALEGLVNDPARRRALAERGLAVVRERYDARTQTAALVAALREVVARRRAAPAPTPASAA
jgi:glycosyltransferase involved in cell wall biosynthesis